MPPAQARTMAVHRAYPKLHTGEPPAEPKLPPSALLRPAERTAKTGIVPVVCAPRIVEILNMADYTHQTATQVPVDEPLFQPSPTEIFFDDFSPLETHEVVLMLRNNDNVPRRVKVIPPDSPFFSVSVQKGVGRGSGKVAPGMEVSYTISFRPEEPVDYFYDLVVVTEREKFVVPLRATGQRAKFDFPDEIAFPCAPVRSESTRTILVRNVGNAKGGFVITPSEGFSVSPETAVLAVDEAVQVTIGFVPMGIGAVQGELCVDYSTGEAVFVQMRGSGEELAVRLDLQVLQSDPTYVTLFSQRTFRILNRSDEAVHFEWKLLRNEQEEEKALMRLRMEDDGEGGQDPTFGLDLSFQDETFRIEPLSGDVWPNAEREVTVTFSPEAAVEYGCVAYCEISGRERRLPIQLQGAGLAAQVFLNFTVIDAGEVTVTSKPVYDVELQNHGDIPASFEVLPLNTLFGPKFEFEPSSADLAPGERRNVRILFDANQLGEFNEEFHIMLKGCPRPLSLTCRGKVIGPSFHIDVRSLDYGRVSVGFLNSKSFTLFNTSDVSFPFNLRVPGDGTMLDREFDIIPSSGTILARGKKTVKVDLISLAKKSYDLQLVADVPGVGEHITYVSISGESQVPRVTLSESSLDFGEVFLRYTYTKTVEIVNNSDLPAKFELVPQDSLSKCVASYDTDMHKGTIPAFGSQTVKIFFKTERLGKVCLPVFFKVIGSTDPSLEVQLNCVGSGPHVALSVSELNWGATAVLTKGTKKVSVSNNSLIPALLRLFILKKGSNFSLSCSELRMEPQSKAEFEVYVFLNHTQQFKDTLAVMVEEGEDFSVPLSARGTGTTIWCSESLDSIDLGDRFTSRSGYREFTLVNRGPIPQTLTWLEGVSSNTEGKSEESTGELKSKGTKKASKGKKNQKPVFSVVPDTLTIEPGQSSVIHIQCLSVETGIISEKLQCKASIEKKQVVILEPVVSAEFFDPLLEFSSSSVDFVYNYEPGVAILPQEVPFSVKNISPLSLEASVRCGLPFMVDPTELSLQSGDTATVNVMFDPGWKADKVSVDLREKLQFSYKDHPQKDSVPLNGDIHFPNLSFEKERVEFGAVLNDTTKRIRVKVTNSSAIEASYSWAFLVEEPTKDASKQPEIPITSVFDVLPIRSTLRPGESEYAEFVFYAHPDRKFKCSALCEVAGGPEYELRVSGSGSTISYRVENEKLEYGNVAYDKAEMRELTLCNTGSVPFDYYFDTSSIPLPSRITLKPSRGSIGAHDKVKVVASLQAGSPVDLDACFDLFVAHFEPVKIDVTARGTFPHLIVSLPRMDPGTFNELLQGARTLMSEAAARASTAENALGSPRPTTAVTTASMSRPGTSAKPLTAPTQGARTEKARSVVSISATKMREMQALESEADREGVRRHIHQLVESAEAELEATRPRVLLEDDAVSVASSRPSSAVAMALDVDCSRFVMSRYVCDFGNVIKGATRRKTFKVTNMGVGAASFEIAKPLKSALSAAGLQVEPDRLSKLPGSPENEAEEFSVTFNTARCKTVSLGPIDLELPLVVKNSPQCLINIRANITIPDVDISCEDVKFGSVLVGHCRVYTIQLTNTKEIPCEWMFKNAEEQGKPAPEVTCHPSNGVLQPGEQCNIELHFIPLASRVFSNVKIPLVIAQNPAKKSIRCRGTGVERAIRFDPPMLEMSPVLPQIGESQQEVTIVNETDVDIEVYSLDFDNKYREELAVLRRCPLFDGSSFMLMDPRAPAQPLQAEILEKEEELVQEEEKAARAAEAENGADGEEAEEGNENADVNEEEAGDSGGVGNVVQPVAPPTARFFLVHGPPNAGVNPVASTLSSQYGIALLRADDVLEELVGEGKVEKENLQAQKAEENADGEEAQEEVAEGDEPKSEETSLAVRVYETLITEKPQSDGDGEGSDEVADPVVSCELLAEAFSFKISRDECQRGAVLCGLRSKYCASQSDVAEAMARALPHTPLNVILCEAVPLDSEQAGGEGQEQVEGEKIEDDTDEKADVQESGEVPDAAKEVEQNEATTDSLSEKEGATDGSAEPEGDVSEVAEVAAPKWWIEHVESEDALKEAFEQHVQKVKVAVCGSVPEVSEEEAAEGETEGTQSLFTPRSVVGHVVHVSANSAASPSELLESVEEQLPEAEPLPGERRVLRIPKPVTREVVRRPTAAAADAVRQPVRCYRLLTPKPVEKSEEDAEQEDNEGAETEEPKFDLVADANRWVIPARDSLKLTVRFTSIDTGSCDEMLGFGILGNRNEISFLCKGVCAYPQISGDSRSLFYKKVRARPDDYISQKEYVISRGIYEFGPLLVSLDRTDPEKHVTNWERFCLSNNGLFPVKVSCLLEKDVDQTCYWVEPKELELGIGEALDVKVFAYPNEEGVVEDKLLLCVQDHPIPVSIPLRCVGQKPALEVVFPEKLVEAEEESDEPKYEAGTEVAFERQLIFDPSDPKERRSTKAVRLVNNGLMPVKWTLDGTEELGGKGFSLSASSGVIQPRSHFGVDITFLTRDVEVGECNADLVLKVQDEHAIQEVAQETPLPVRAEAYRIDYGLTLPDTNEATGDNCIDFGTVKVVDKPSKTMKVENSGKYEVGFKFFFKRKRVAQFFTITPAEGNLSAGGSESIEVTFNCEEEVKLVDCEDLRCSIIETMTGEVVLNVPVKLSVSSVFSKCRVLPAKGIGFGALTKDAKKTRSFDLINQGVFDFTYTILPLDSPADAAPPSAPSTLGPFSIDAPTGVIAPGASKTVSVEYTAGDAGTNVSMVGIRISESDSNDPQSEKGVPYEFAAESCIPGINIVDMVDVFEEQQVMKQLDSSLGELRNIFFEEAKMFSFGQRIVGQDVEVRFKISNPMKVPCEVDLQTCAREGKSDEGEEAFEVQPAKMQIPVHEHQYASVYFKPNTLTTCIAKFEARVANSSENNLLSFELRGEGTLPRVVVEEPSELSEAGQPTWSFPRTFIGRTLVRRIRLRNSGVVPATLRFDSQPDSSSAFSFSGKGAQVLLEVGASREFELSFSPREEGEFRFEVKLVVLHNAYEDTIIAALGEGYKRDIAFEGLPNDCDDELAFGDAPVGVARSVTFQMRNCTGNSYRFVWPEHECVTFSPSEGHLLSHAIKEVEATFLARKPVSLEDEELSLDLREIKREAPGDWDNAMKEVKWVNDEESPRKKPKKVVSVPAEPEHEVVEETETASVLKVKAVSDYLAYELADGSLDVGFRNCMMYQTLTHSVELKNTCKASFDYEFSLEPEGGFTEDVECPFRVIPESGTVEGGTSSNITIEFAPREVDSFAWNLMGRIPHLSTRPAPAVKENEPEGEEGTANEEPEGDPAPAPQDPPRLLLKGRSLRPRCHFELSPSDWLSSGRRPGNLPGPGGVSGGSVDPATRCVEFESLGTHVRNTKRFYVSNPTNVAWQFEISCEDAPSDIGLAKSFKCLPRRGLVLAGKKAEITFEFTPHSEALLESFWKFEIAAHKISVPLLIVGRVKEPGLSLERTHINFNALLVGGRAVETVKLLNTEHLPFSFNFDPSSYGADEGRQELRIYPTRGTVSPDSELPITFTFVPESERAYNFNVVCNVKKKASQLTMNVKGEGFAVHSDVTLEGGSTGKDTVMSPGMQTACNFGQVQVNERVTRAVSISNSGKFPVAFNWNLPKSRMISVVPSSGTVAKAEKMQVLIVFHPITETSIDGLSAVLEITNGPKYPLAIGGVARRPALRFSALDVDFGACFLHAQGVEPVTKVIRVTNEDSAEISYDVYFDNTKYLEVDASSTVLAPRESRDVTLTFMPRSEQEYSEQIPFEINGLTTVNVKVRGSGEERRVEVVNPTARNTTFGSVRVGQVAARSVRVVNRSAASAVCSLASCVEALSALDIRVSPVEFELQPRQTMSIDISLAPRERRREFSEEVILEVNGVGKPLTKITGAASGLELKLETDMLFFGAVARASKSVRRLQLDNTGDVGTKFRWDIDAFRPDFSISPVEGFLAAHDEVTFDVVFNPQHVSDDVRKDGLALYCEGGEPLRLTLTGMCVDTEPQDTVLSFNTKVRTQEKQSLPPVQNKSEGTWRIVPIIDNDFWRGPEFLEIPPGGSAAYELTYEPLSMSKDDEPHSGTVFLPIPDGSALLYRLEGVAGAPDSCGSIERTVKAKVVHVEALPVQNWLARPQRFDVKIDIEDKHEATTLKGSDVIDVAARQERSCKLKFFSYVEGVTKARVTLTNSATGEYLFYDLVLTATTPDVLEEVSLSSMVRQMSSHTFNIPNPLDKAVVVTPSCDNADIVVDESYTLQPRTETPVVVSYRPLAVKESKARLSFNSSELGTFLYDMLLVATEQGVERSMSFTAALGSSSVQAFRFTHVGRDKVDFKLVVEPADCFSVDSSTLSVAGATGRTGTEASVDVRFEPCALGTVSGQLIVSAPGLADYVCLLNGKCEKPSVQGPISVKGSANISFKNVFNDSVTYSFFVDNPAFSVSKPSEVLGAKQSTQIGVNFKAPAPGASARARLQVKCPDLANAWVFYLEGSG